jgi:2-(3-amino-3-carboxypropyl)histidine synthase
MMGEYDLELNRIEKEIKKARSKLVCIQLPDGLKQKATEISEFIEKNTQAKCLIWMSTCFGACDVPKLPKEVDMLIQFGHSPWKNV